MTREQKMKMHNELSECKTLNEMWLVLGRYYDLDKKLVGLQKNMAVHQLNAKIGIITTALSIKQKT